MGNQAMAWTLRTLALVALGSILAFAALAQGMSATDPAVEDAARRAWADLNPGAAAREARVQTLGESPVLPGDQVLDTLSANGSVRAAHTLTTGPGGLPLTMTFFVVDTAGSVSIVPSVPGRTLTRPHLQMVLTPSVQREAVMRAGLSGVCTRDRDVPVTDTLVMPADAFGHWEEVWKVALCQGGTEWITVRFQPGRWGQEPAWAIVGP